MADQVTSLVMTQLKLSLSDCATWRTLVGAADRAEAAAAIHLDELPEPADGQAYSKSELEALRPYALIWQPEGDALAMLPDAMGGGRQWRYRGRIMLRMSRAVPAGLTRAQAIKDWRDTLEAILQELGAYAANGAEEYLDFTAAIVADGPGFHNPDYDPGQGEEQGVDFEFRWGDRHG